MWTDLEVSWTDRYISEMDRIKRKLRILWQKILEMGQEDPRRVIHSLKVGLAVTLVSLLYLMEPLFKGMGHNAIWAVMTVVVVLQFTAGATLCKGVNRGLGTLLAGTLGFLIGFITDKTGRVAHAIFIATSVFLIGAASTYMRFIPCIKKNYDYGIVIFILTFNMITVSSYRVENILKIAKMRLYMILIGCGVSLFVSLFVFPFWSGEDLHTSTISKLERLAKSIQDSVDEYFNDQADRTQLTEENADEDPMYKTVMHSKHMDETLALYASWEPRYSWQGHKFPWKQYVKLGAALRHFGYSVVNLHGCLQTEIQTPKSVRVMFKGPCTRLAEEVSRVLMQLANSIRNRQHCSSDILSSNLDEVLRDLDTAFKSQPKLFLGSNYSNANKLAVATAAADQKQDDAITRLEYAEALPFAAFASTLVEMVARLDRVKEEVKELSSIAHFKEFKPDAAKHTTVMCI